MALIRHCRNCRERLRKAASFCCMCGTKVGKFMENVNAYEDNTSNPYMNGDKKREIIIKVLSVWGWNIVKECGKNVYVISEQDKALSSFLYLIDLRDVSDINLDEIDALFGVRGIKCLLLEMSKGKGWVGNVNENILYYIREDRVPYGVTNGKHQLELHQVNLDNMEDVKLRYNAGWENEGELDVIKCSNGSLRVLYYSQDSEYYRSTKKALILDENGIEIWKKADDQNIQLLRLRDGHCQYIEVEDLNPETERKVTNYGLLDIYAGKLIFPCRYNLFAFLREKQSDKIIVIPYRWDVTSDLMVRSDENGNPIAIIDNYYCIENHMVRMLEGAEIQQAKNLGIEQINFFEEKGNKNYKWLSKFNNMNMLSHIEEFSNI